MLWFIVNFCVDRAAEWTDFMIHQLGIACLLEHTFASLKLNL